MRIRSYVSYVIVGLILTSTCSQSSNGDRSVILQEASGIARLEDKLIMVGDDADGRYFELKLEGQKGPIIPIDPREVKEMILPGAELAMDLEGIDVLADGRIALLSEQLRCLVAREKIKSDHFVVIAEYDRTLTELGNRGLEGLAVVKLEDGSSQVAVLWEGGYPEYYAVPLQLRDQVGRFPLNPVVVVHRIRDGEVAGLVHQPLKYITLNVPKPAGDVPLAQRFRATDLVWHRWHDKGEGGDIVQGFIVLLSSENSPTRESGVAKEYEIKILQRFDQEGEPVGDPLHINDVCREVLNAIDEETDETMGQRMSTHIIKVRSRLEDGDYENINWEGLGWFEEGESLIAIYDQVPKDPPFALIIEVPEEWK
ncbi:MAG: hypothetical protein GTO24_07975 [candidate division Zixibacteria bacterium]|nr:hypothetical protein [candidate division Zixibacteria bacterium]